MREGLLFENDQLIYYKNDKPYHAGAIKVDGDIYYISSHGRAVKGRHAVHREMGNDILKRGVYTFGEDYKLIEGSYTPPKKKKNRQKGISKKQHKWLNIVVISAVVLALGASYFGIKILPMDQIKAKPTSTTAPTETVAPTTGSKNIIIPSSNFSDIKLCSGAALRLYNGEISVESAIETGSPYRSMDFEYAFTGDEAILLVSENENFDNAAEYELPADKSQIQLDNLKTGTKYYWKVIAGDETQSGAFETVRSTRFVSMEGAYNTRDIGGYETADGKTVKQGLIIRGTEIDGLVEPHFFVSSDSAKEIQKTFQFVYDFDLRASSHYTGAYQSRLGENVKHKFYAAPQYGQIFDETYRESLKSIFTDLANPDNYPMYLHCTYGADRTGTIVLLLQGVLNMSEEEMIREYQRTGFHQKAYGKSTVLDVVIENMRLYEGETLSEKIVTFLTTEIGVTQAEIDSIRNIHLSE